MKLISNITFNGHGDTPAPGRRAVFANQNNEDIFRPDGTIGRAELGGIARQCAAEDRVLVIEDERYLSLPVSVRTPYYRELIDAAYPANVMLYGRPSQAQWAINDLARSGFKSPGPERINFEKWRAANTADRDAGLFTGLCATMTEYRLYHGDFDLHPLVQLTVSEQRRMGLPVCALIDPRYAPNGGIEPNLAGQWMPRPTIQTLLRELAIAGVEWLCLWHGLPEPRTQEWDDLFADIESAFPGSTGGIR